MTVDDREVKRIDAVRRYDILDSPPDQAFDRITALAARACDAPIAIVSIVDEDRIWFKSHHGLDIDQIDREEGLCASAILHEGAWIIENAKTDPRALANPLVAGEFGLRFYLGVPLRTADGFNLGTLCVLDFEPREATDRQVADLTDLAAIVMDELELRLAALRNHATQAAMRAQAESLARTLQEGLLPAQLPTFADLELAARYEPADRERLGGDFYDAFASDDGIALVIGDVRGHGPHAGAVTSLTRHTIRALCVGNWSPVDVLHGLNRAVLASGDDGDPPHCTVALLRLRSIDAGYEVAAAMGGHPLPLVLRADGTVDEVGVPGALVGCFETSTWVEQRFTIGPGDAVVLYTDGLTEARGGSTRFDDALLRQVLARLSGQSASAIAATLLEGMHHTEFRSRDDVALLVARSILAQ